jgi:hypothetical protein
MPSKPIGIGWVGKLGNAFQPASTTMRVELGRLTTVVQTVRAQA